MAEKRKALEKQEASEDAEKESNGNEGVDKRFAGKSANQYFAREGAAKLDTMRTGNPRLVYESKLVKGFEPTGDIDGVEVTRCLGEES